MHRSTTLDGTIVEGLISAADQQSVQEKLKSKDLIPLSITTPREDQGRFAGRKVSRSALVSFTSELAILIAAGLPLDRSLQILSDISESRNLREVTDSILNSVREGSSFSDALRARSSVFPTFYANMVRAGEAGGTLDLALSNLGEFLESSQEIKEHTTSAMIYPLILVATGGISIILLMTFVIPRFSAVFSELGGTLPLSARILLDVSVFVQAYWWAILILCAGAWLGFKAAIRSEAGRFNWDFFKLRLMGRLITELETARFCRTLGTLLASGVPVLQALRNASDVVGNRVISAGIERVSSGAKEGRGITAPLQEAGVFPPLALSMIKVGEETGRIDEMLIRVADTYERRLKRTIKRLISLMEPVLILVMGLVIGFIVVSMLLAVFSITDMPF